MSIHLHWLVENGARCLCATRKVSRAKKRGSSCPDVRRPKERRERARLALSRLCMVTLCLHWEDQLSLFVQMLLLHLHQLPPPFLSSSSTFISPTPPAASVLRSMLQRANHPHRQRTHLSRVWFVFKLFVYLPLLHLMLKGLSLL